LRALLAAALLAAAALLSGCGGDEETSSSSSPAPTPTETPALESPEDQPGGAGDEEAIRVPVQFTVDGEGITPPQVAVPAFLALELSVSNDLPEPVTVRLEGAEPLTVAPGETGRMLLEGRRPGSYRVDAGAAGEAILVTGAEPGP